MSLSQNDIRPPGNEDAKDLLCSVLDLVYIDLVDVDRVDVDAIDVDQSTDLLMLTMLMLTLLMLTIRVSQKNQKSEFCFATKPTGFHRLDEPPEKISAL